ncbi:MAG: MerC domain-containing protein [Verrucomicrobiota bacterium]
MNRILHLHNHSGGWLDSLAIGMSLVCAVHCLITPALLVLMPILATTFWVHQDFHLWMLFLVLPVTGVAFFLGCRKHKDRIVLFLGGMGLTLLVGVAIYESFIHAGFNATGHETCAHCLGNETSKVLNTAIMTNVLGGAFLLSGHARNFMLCRRLRCHHE